MTGIIYQTKDGISGIRILSDMAFTKGGFFFGSYDCFCGCGRFIAVSVIDENDNQSQADLNGDWEKFKKDHPRRKLFLLRPAPGYTDVKIPTNSWAPNGTGPITVSRDEGNEGNKSDWYGLIGLDTILTRGFKISLFVDNSGSMTTDTVRASYNYFIQKLAAHFLEDGTPYPVTLANRRLIIVTNGSEEYIKPHLRCE